MTRYIKEVFRFRQRFLKKAGKSNSHYVPLDETSMATPHAAEKFR
jgi:hypothetical protein